MIGLIISLLTSRLGGWLAGGLAVGAVLLFLKLETGAKERAQAAAATNLKGMQIGYQAYVALYQEREKIAAAAQAAQEKLNELQRNNDLEGLSASINNGPGPAARRVRRLPAARGHPIGSPKTAARSENPGAGGAAYQGADGDQYRE